MNRPRILVIDDEADVRSLVRELLERTGYEVTDARDGRECLRSFFESRPDAVVLDVSMPDLDGWTTLERIRDLSDVPVLMLTTHAQELEDVRALKASADDYVTKPFGRQELLARVEALLRRRTSRTDAPERYDDTAISIDFDRRECHRVIEFSEAEGHEQVADRPERPRSFGGRVDTDADDRKVWVRPAELVRTGEAGGPDRIDDQRRGRFGPAPRARRSRMTRDSPDRARCAGARGRLPWDKR